MREATLQTKAGCHQYWAWESFAISSEQHKALGCLLAVRKAQQLREPQAVHNLDEAGSQEVTRLGRVVFPRLVPIQILCQC